MAGHFSVGDLPRISVARLFMTRAADSG